MTSPYSMVFCDYSRAVPGGLLHPAGTGVCTGHVTAAEAGNGTP